MRFGKHEVEKKDQEGLGGISKAPEELKGGSRCLEGRSALAYEGTASAGYVRAEIGCRRATGRRTGACRIKNPHRWEATGEDVGRQRRVVEPPLDGLAWGSVEKGCRASVGAGKSEQSRRQG